MKKNRIVFFAAALTLFAGITASGENLSPVDGKLKEGIALHDAAHLEPAKNIERGKEILGSLMESSPVAKAYYGSLVTIEAGEYAKKKDGIKALSLLGKGTDLIDEAVSEDPENPDIRFLRMINSYEVSEGSPVNRYKAMKKDVDWLDERKRTFDANWQGTIELYKGLYLAKARKIDDALAAFDACIAVSPGSPEAALAGKQIDRYAE